MNLLDICKKAVRFATLVATPCFVVAVASAVAFGLVGSIFGVALILCEFYVDINEGDQE